MTSLQIEIHPYPAYKPTGVPWLGNVPEHWEVRRLKGICRLAYGDSLPSEARKAGNVSVYGSNGTVGLHAVANTSGECIIIGRKGSFGKVRFSQESAFAIDTTYFVDSRYSGANMRWLFYMLGWLQLDEVSRDSAVPGLSREDAYQRLSLYPPLPEQHAIVRYLDHADRRIRRYVSAKRKLIALLEEEKQAVINQAVTRGLDPNAPLKPSGVEWLGDVPEHWEMRRLKRVLYSLIDCEHKTAPAIDLSSYRVVRTSAVREGTLLLSGTYCTSNEAFAEWTRRGSLEPGDVIFTREAPAGEACVVPSGLNLCLGQRTVLMKVDRHAYEPQFLVHMLYAGPPHDEIELASQGSTLPHFNVEDIGALPVLAPPVSEQREIVDWLEAETGDLTYAIARARRQIELLQEYRTRLIADVVTGKLDVREVAAQLPDEASEEEPIDESSPFADDMEGNPYDADDSVEEPLTESKEIK